MNHISILKYTFFIWLFCFWQMQGQNSPEKKRAYHWYFGAGAGLDFTTGNAVAVTNGSLHTYEGCSSASDISGNLLFYTDGDTIWDKNHLIMPNGTGLLGGCGVGSSAGGGLIVRQPNSNSIFYVFTSDCGENLGAAGLRYSTIDMSLNAGTGSVTTKNNLLYAPSTEGLAATYHCDGQDVWVMSHELNNNNWRAYKITSAGLNTTPVISSIGSIFNSYLSIFRFSPNGSRLAACGSSTNWPAPQLDLLFDFDNTTGVVCHSINLYKPYAGGLHPTFSPDNSKLYYAVGINVFLYQYDLNAGNDSATISNSASIIDTTYQVGIIALGPNGKIYTGESGKDSLGTIQNPNAAGIACNYIRNNVPLQGRQVLEGLPDFISNYLGDNTILCKSCMTGVNESETNSAFSFYPNPSDNLITFINFDHLQLSEIIFYNYVGKEVKRINSKDTYLKNISTADLVDGIYFVNIKIDNNSRRQKLIIKH
jgi:hypothetical protein